MEDEKEEEVNPAYIEAKVSKNYWIIDAGRKNDYTTKLWDVSRYRDLVKLFPHVTFVQIGLEEHYHPALEGHNVVNLIGKTPGRTLLYLMYHAYGVITPVSYPMHLSAAVEANPIYGYKHRPTIVIAGGREPAAWEAYSTHQFLHKCGMLSCAREGGCWVSRVEKLNDNDPKDKNLCLQPVQTASGQVIPKCLDMIALQDVAEIMKQYMENIPLAKEVQSGN
jgi:ADP-heptose:LPS heptosyltransferase